VLLAVVVAIAGGAVWWVLQDDSSSPEASEDASSATSDRASDSADGSGGRDATDGTRVVVISVDGLGSAWVSRSSTPAIADLITQGAGTVNARTEVEKTVTLPNHTGMVTGRRVDARRGGHGVTWNRTSDGTVVPGTESVFSTIDEAGGSSAVFVGKQKFEMWGRAWPDAIDELEIERDQSALVRRAIADLTQEHRDLLFLHLAGPDVAGHEHGWGSAAYLQAVAKADHDVDRVVSAIEDDPELSRHTVVVLTADHGGVPGGTVHTDRERATNYTIPFAVWGAGVTRGDLYALNPDYRDPGKRRPGYGGRQPVRNGDVANVVTDLLGLDPVPGSRFDAEHDLDVE
jgi:hypothetical protein